MAKIAKKWSKLPKNGPKMVFFLLIMLLDISDVFFFGKKINSDFS